MSAAEEGDKEEVVEVEDVPGEFSRMVDVCWYKISR